MSAFVICDTSSAIEMTSRGGKSASRLYATPGIKAEMGRHRYVCKAGKREINDSVYDSVDVTDSSEKPAFDKIRYDAYWAWLESSTEKKRVVDPISREDLGLLAEAMLQAKEGRNVEIYTEDAHISGTIRHMLNGRYSHLNGKVKVRSVAA